MIRVDNNAEVRLKRLGALLCVPYRGTARCYITIETREHNVTIMNALSRLHVYNAASVCHASDVVWSPSG